MFSVLIPVYNGGGFIDDAIKSVIGQTETDWELIIVNDGSADDTGERLKKYAGNEKIRVITQENMGVSAARNNGAAAAKGSYLAFLDADDLWYENHLAVLKSLIEKYPDAGLYCTFARVELKNGKVIAESEYFKGRGDDDICFEDFFEEYHKDKSVKMFAMSSTCISREAFKKSGGFPVGCTMGEDLELTLVAAAYYPVALSGKCTAAYKAVNSTASKDRSFDPDWHFFDTAQGLYKDGEIPEEKRKNLRRLMNWFMMRRCRHYIIDGNRKKAWRAFLDTDARCLEKKDLVINLMLLFIPGAIVRRIFAVRWRGKA